MMWIEGEPEGGGVRGAGTGFPSCSAGASEIEQEKGAGAPGMVARS